MSDPGTRRGLPDDAPMLLSPLQIAAFVVVFLLFIVLGRAVGGWIEGDRTPARAVSPATPTATVELAETLEPA